jgi:hypothetical protein
MTLDDIPANLGAMAGAQPVGHAELLPGCRHVIDIVGLDLEAILPQMLDPFAAASAVGTFEDFAIIP